MNVRARARPFYILQVMRDKQKTHSETRMHAHTQNAHNLFTINFPHLHSTKCIQLKVKGK